GATPHSATVSKASASCQCERLRFACSAAAEASEWALLRCPFRKAALARQTPADAAQGRFSALLKIVFACFRGSIANSGVSPASRACPRSRRTRSLEIGRAHV